MAEHTQKQTTCGQAAQKQTTSGPAFFRVVDASPVTKISKILSKFRRVMHINDESVSSDKGYN